MCNVHETERIYASGKVLKKKVNGAGLKSYVSSTENKESEKAASGSWIINIGLKCEDRSNF